MREHNLSVLVPRSALSLITASQQSGGALTLRYSKADDIYVIRKVEIGPGALAPAVLAKDFEVLNRGDGVHEGQWARVDEGSDLHLTHRYLQSRPGTHLEIDEFRDAVKKVADPGALTGLVITFTSGLTEEDRAYGVEEVVGWAITREGATPIDLVVEPAIVGLHQLSAHWPVAELQRMSVLVVGLGSIGAVVAEALAGYGVGRLALLDPDRFLWHNGVRHVLGRDSVGAHKAVAVKRHLERKWDLSAITSYVLDVAEDADQVRRLMEDVDIVVCAADGIAPRRVVSHLARRASTPAILACVLDNGSIGEVIRLRPAPAFGCLLCQRAHLANAGAIDAEADQELDYGTGLVHRPMTAVGPDLHMVGLLAAKMAVATHLEFAEGDHTQRLPGEYAILGLRPGGDLEAPFGVAGTGQIDWHPGVRPRRTCTTCGES
jgi:hypothetical protein